MAKRLDLSTIGIKFGWACETTAGTQPTAFKWIQRCKAIDGIALSVDNIDVTALEDEFRKYVAGLKDTGGTWSLTFSNTDAFQDDWNEMKDAAKVAYDKGLATWAEVYIPGMTKACFVTIQPGEIPLGDVSVGSALEVAVSNIINEYKGWLTAAEPTYTEASGT